MLLMCPPRQMDDLHKFLETHGASEELAEYAAGKKSLAVLWQNCPRADWMVWVLNKADFRDQVELRLFAVACAKRFWHLMNDSRVRNAIQTAELYAKGRGTRADLKRAQMNSGEGVDEATDRKDSQGTWVAKLAWATTLDSPLLAASQACLYGAMVARCGAFGPPRAAWLEAMAFQAEKLREIMGNPFSALESEPATTA